MVNRAARWGIVGLVLAAAPLGCGKSGDHPAPTASVPGPSDDAATAAAADTPSPPKPLPFTEAVSEDSPEEQLPPPDQTVNGLTTGLVRIRVQKLWDTIPFTTPAGKKLA